MAGFERPEQQRDQMSLRLVLLAESPRGFGAASVEISQDDAPQMRQTSSWARIRSTMALDSP